MLFNEYKKLLQSLNEKKDLESFINLLNLFNIPIPRKFDSKTIIIAFDNDSFKYKNIETGDLYHIYLKDGKIQLLHDFKPCQSIKQYNLDSDDLTPDFSTCIFELDDGSLLHLTSKDKISTLNGHDIKSCTLELSKFIKQNDDYKLIFTYTYSFYEGIKDYFVSSVLSENDILNTSYSYSKDSNKAYLYNVKKRKDTNEVIESVYKADSNITDFKQLEKKNIVAESFSLNKANIIIKGDYWYNENKYTYTFKVIKSGKYGRITLDCSNNEDINVAKNIYLSSNEKITSDDLEKVIDFVKDCIPYGCANAIFGELEQFKQVVLRTELVGSTSNNYFDKYFRNYKNFEELSFNILYNLKNINDEIDAKIIKDTKAVNLKLTGNKG